MSQVLSLRVPNTLAERLDRFARRQGNGMTRSRASLILLEEASREAEYALIEFRDSTVGRQPHLKGSRLTVWWIVRTAKEFERDLEKTAAHFALPIDSVKAAMHYYEGFSEEIDHAIEDNYVSFEEMKRRLPGTRLTEIKIEQDGSEGKRV